MRAGPCWGSVLPKTGAAQVKKRRCSRQEREKEKYVFRERASVLMGAVLPKTMDVQAVEFRLYGNWTDGRIRRDRVLSAVIRSRADAARL